MKTEQNNRHEMVAKWVGKLKQPKRSCVIERMLPSDAVLYLFQHSEVLRIDMLVEKRSKEDYVVIQIDADDKRVYLFQVFLDALQERFSLQGLATIFPDRYNQRIASLFAKLNAT